MRFVYLAEEIEQVAPLSLIELFELLMLLIVVVVGCRRIAQPGGKGQAHRSISLQLGGRVQLVGDKVDHVTAFIVAEGGHLLGFITGNIIIEPGGGGDGAGAGAGDRGRRVGGGHTRRHWCTRWKAEQPQ